ncbi:hypothetical protein HZS_71 [Henneguya salminicola]|nr:hypothetical protein HZS_71 [Henneguya salminicola]
MFVEVIRNEFEFYEQHCVEIRQNGSNIRYKNKLYIHSPLRVSSCLGKFRLFSHPSNKTIYLKFLYILIYHSSVNDKLDEDFLIMI